MGAHRKPKAKPTAFAAVVTAAIVVPAGTAAAASYGAFGPPNADPSGQSAAGLLAAKANSAATSAASSRIRHVVVTPIPTPTASAPTATAKPSAQPQKPNASPTSASPSPSASASQSTSAKNPGSSPPPSPTPTSSPTPQPTAPAQSNQYQNVALSSLEPTGLYGAQQYFTLTNEQLANAKTIVAVTKQRGMPLYAAVIATATAMQESSLINLTYATNYDSLGLFQQRPSMGWGTAAQVTDPAYATNAFLSALATYAPNYTSQALWTSAQAVQRSGLPTAYAQWEDQAAMVVQAIVNGTA